MQYQSWQLNLYKQNIFAGGREFLSRHWNPEVFTLQPSNNTLFSVLQPHLNGPKKTSCMKQNS